jgi:hypothetical protein
MTTERANPLRQGNPAGADVPQLGDRPPPWTKLFLRRSVFVKRFTHEMTLREVPVVARTTKERCSPPNFDREPSPDAQPESAI